MSVCQIKSVLLDENVVQRHMIMKPANSYVWYPYRKVRGIYNSFSIKPEFLVTVNPSESDQFACEFFLIFPYIYMMWSRSEKAMVVPSVRAIFQIMASTGSLRASSPFGGVARSNARVERERRRAFSRGSLGLLASSPFMASKLTRRRTPLALARACSQTSVHRNLFTPRPPYIYGKVKRNCLSKF